MKPTADDRRRALRRGARRELEAAKTLGTERVHRGRGRCSAPDVKPVQLPDGRALGPEVKTRKRLPKLLVEGLAQARRYFRGATIPIVVVSELGGAALAVLELADLVALLGIDIPLVARPRRRAERQLDLFQAPSVAAKENHDGCI